MLMLFGWNILQVSTHRSSGLLPGKAESFPKGAAQGHGHTIAHRQGVRRRLKRLTLGNNVGGREMFPICWTVRFLLAS